MQWPRQIDTPRLCLRDPRPADAPDMFAAYAGQAEVLRYLGWRPHASVADTARHIGFETHRWLKGSAWVWVMTMREPKVPASPASKTSPVFGQIELVPMSHPSEQAHHLRLGYMMAPAQRGQGLMTEALQALLPLALAQPGVWRVDALCDVDNPASAAVLARVGMQREGCLRRVVRHPLAADTPRDAWVYALTRDDLPGWA
jgi:[ribosomal protein S5]-alanine N-acetyltransferase